jgi:rubrerythrin
MTDSEKEAYEIMRSLIDDLSEEDAKELIELLIKQEKERNKLKELNKKSVNELKQAFWNVLKLAKGGQQPWWTGKLKQDSNEAIEIIEQYYNEKYNEQNN